METLQYCECCGQKISKKRRRIERNMVTALLKAVSYCIATRQRKFRKKDVKSFTHTEYTLITFLVKFGLLYKDATMKAGEFGIPFKRVKDFLEGRWTVAEYYEEDPLLQDGDNGKRVMAENRLYIHEIPNHTIILQEHPHTIEYIKNNTFTDTIG